MDNLLRVKDLKDITVDDLSNNFKMEYIAKFQNAYKEDLLNLTMIKTKTNKKVRKTKQQLCKEIGISDTTLKRYMKDLGMKSFYRHSHTNKVKRKKVKPIENKDNLNIDEEYDYDEAFDKTIKTLKN